MPPISRPILIFMAATVALLAFWGVALRPKPVAVQNTPLAATQQIPKAQQAVAASDAANAKAQAAGDGGSGAGAPAPAAPAAAPVAPAAGGPAPTASAPAASAPATAAPASGPGTAAAPAAPVGAATPAAAAPKVSASKRSPAGNAAVARDLRRGKVVVLLFWNPAAADDIAARGALRELNLHGGRVVVRVVPIARAARYASFTGPNAITQSPTTVIVARKGKPRVIAGLAPLRRTSRAVRAALTRR